MRGGANVNRERRGEITDGNEREREIAVRAASEQILGVIEEIEMREEEKEKEKRRRRRNKRAVKQCNYRGRWRAVQTGSSEQRAPYSSLTLMDLSGNGAELLALKRCSIEEEIRARRELAAQTQRIALTEGLGRGLPTPTPTADGG